MTAAFYKKAIVAIFLVVIGIVVFRHATARIMVCEYEDVINYKLELNQKTKIPESISGISGQAFCVSDVRIEKKPPKMLILVDIGFCSGDKRGNFKVPLDVTDNINELRFGKKEYLLWSRPPVETVR